MEYHTLLGRLATGERLKEHEIDWLSEYVREHFKMSLIVDVMNTLFDSDDARGASRFHNALKPDIGRFFRGEISGEW